MKPVDDVDMDRFANPGPSPAVVAERKESASHVLSALEGLPRNQQEVVRLKFQSGLSYKEISQITGLTVSNVGFLLHTALRSIRQKLDRN